MDKHRLRFALCVSILTAWVCAELVMVRPCWAQTCPCDQVKVPAEAPQGTDVQKGLRFTETAQYRHEFRRSVDGLQDFCQRYRLQHPEARNLAIVSDIDETLLDNRPELARHDALEIPWFREWVKLASAPVLKRTYNFLNWGRAHGFAIFLVTGRPEALRLYTVQNLIKDNITYDGLYMRPDGDDGPAEVYKGAVRKTIEDMGFVVVGSIGDQFSDLANGHDLQCAKLPNRMYFIK